MNHSMEGCYGNSDYTNPKEANAPTDIETAHSQNKMDEITDQETADLAGKVLPNEMRRIAEEMLIIPRNRVALLSQDDPWVFAYKCFDIWRNSCHEDDKRAELYKSLSLASEEGLICRDAIVFLLQNAGQNCDTEETDDTSIIALRQSSQLPCARQTTKILDHEVSRLAYSFPPKQIFRIAIEFLKLRQIQVEHAETKSKNDAWLFAENCLKIWTTIHWGEDVRAKLYNCLLSVSKAGLLGRDVFAFLKEDPEATPPSSGFQKVSFYQEITGNERAASSRQTGTDAMSLMALNQLAGLFDSENMEDAALHVFNFPDSEFQFRKKLIIQQLMAHVLCAWWVNEQGSVNEKKSKLFEKLHILEARDLVPKEQLQSVAMQLEFQPVLSVLHPTGPPTTCLAQTNIEFVTTVNIERSKSAEKQPISENQNALEGKRAIADEPVAATSGGPHHSEEFQTSGVGIKSNESDLEANNSQDTNDSYFSEYDDSIGSSSESEIDVTEAATNVTVTNSVKISTTMSFWNGPMRDAFICYCMHKEGLKWIKDILVPVEEENRLNLIIAQRDFIVGCTVLQNITHGINNSRRFVHIVSNESLKSRWCNEELRIALYKEIEMGKNRENIIHLVLPDTNLKSASRFVKDSMKEHLCIYMRNYDDSLTQERLVYAIQGKRPVLSSRVAAFFSDVKWKLFKSGSS